MQNQQNCLQKVTTLIFILIIVNLDCVRTQRTITPKSCTLPIHPLNGQWSLAGTITQLEPGQEVPSSTSLSVGCDSKYTLDGSSLITCKDGKWAPELGQCLELCPPIITTPSTLVTCTTNGKTVDDCKKAINGTIATFKCAPFYENPELNRNPFRFCRDGSWGQEVPSCTPICGEKPGKSENEKKYYPWNVVIFKKDEEKISFRCTGTLINERIILTSANCVADDFGKKLSLNLYKLAAGKSSGNYEDSSDTDAQFSDIEETFIHDDFKGAVRKYVNNIAVIVARTAFNMTERIQPVCFDWNKKLLKEFQYPGTTGYIAGPLKSQVFPNLEQVLEIEVPFINDKKCNDMLRETGGVENGTNFEAYFTYDKICAGYINSSQTPMCLIDSGVGLVSKNQQDDKYYITGILSSKNSIDYSNVTCDDQLWGLFTKVSLFLNFVIEKNELYTPIRRSYFQTFCGTKSVKTQTLIINGNNVTKGDYPWQVALYRISETRKRLICGGSLINQRVILTAAHCVTNSQGDVLPKQLYVVAVGKYFANFDDSRDTLAQFSTLRHIYVPNEYRGEVQNYFGDIAILVTENSFVISKSVEPVCIDWDAKYEKQFLKPSVSGFVTGWGLTEENDKPSEVLKELQVPYLENEECKMKLPSDYEIYLTTDKMCSGHVNKGTSVCQGDSGGGLVFKNPNDDKYYIAGIVSLSPRAPAGGCDSQQLALYTRVSKYVSDFILEKVRLYWA